MSTIDPLKLRDLLIAYFDIEELNGLMFGLGIRKDLIAGDTITSRAQALVIYSEGVIGLPVLLAECERMRPAADWGSVIVETSVRGVAVTADPQREASLGQLRAFQSLLDEGRQTYLRHNEQRGRLQRMIYLNHVGEIPPYKGYDDLFYKMYERLNEEEMELFHIVRGNTKVGMHRVNGRIREWTEGHEVAVMFPQKSPAVAMLERELMELRVHLAEWFAKYEETFLPDPKRTLVYLGDEKRQGTKWPPGLNDALAKMLSE